MSARTLMNRFILGTYYEIDTLTLNRDLCQVLDHAIDCFEDEDLAATAKLGPESCSIRWSVDGCWAATAWNKTAYLLCPEVDYSKYNIPEKEVCNVELHCNATTGDWNGRVVDNDYYGNLETREKPNASDYSMPSSLPDMSDNPLYQDINLPDGEQFQSEVTWYSMLGHFVTVGHAISLASLVIALTLLSLAKRLHCTRTYIHMNLMAAFMLRGLVWILHVAAFQVSNSVEDLEDDTTLELATRVFSRYNASALPQLMVWKKQWCAQNDQTSYYIWCRLYYVLLNYSVTANYFWLLVEGIYLALLLRTMYANTSHKMFMRGFLVLGWVLPWLPVSCSVLAKLLDPNENNSCWFEDKNSAYWWIIKVPIILSLVINFFIFVLVIKVVGSKLKVNQRHGTDEGGEHYKWRLVKSTGALIPLLGIQYIITVFLSEAEINNPTALFVKRAFEVSFTSIQGFLVAIIYCFLNAEVQDECKRYWNLWKDEWELKMGIRQRRKEGISNTCHSNATSRTHYRKSSVQSNASTRISTMTVTGRSSVASEQTPPRTRGFGSNLSYIEESSPQTNGKVPHINGDLASSLSENVFDSSKSLASTTANIQFTPGESSSNNRGDVELMLTNGGNSLRSNAHDSFHLDKGEINEIYPMCSETDQFLQPSHDIGEIRESML